MIIDAFTVQDDIRCLVNRMTSIIRTEVGGIERDLASHFHRNIKNIEEPPYQTPRAANESRLSKQLYIRFEG